MSVHAQHVNQSFTVLKWIGGIRNSLGLANPVGMYVQNASQKEQLNSL